MEKHSRILRPSSTILIVDSILEISCDLLHVVVIDHLGMVTSSCLSLEVLKMGVDKGAGKNQEIILTLTMNGTEDCLFAQAPSMMTDKYTTTEGFHGLACAYTNVPDLHIMWLLYLCDAHQQNQSWAEAAQCAVAVAGVIMQVILIHIAVLMPCIYSLTRESNRELNERCPALIDYVNER